jgi:hypothetical protein
MRIERRKGVLQAAREALRRIGGYGIHDLQSMEPGA